MKKISQSAVAIRYWWAAWLTACVFLLHPVMAAAQEYPNKPITLLVAYPPGGGVDAVTRLVGQKLSEVLSVSVVVENRPGFSGNIGAASAARAPADGYTLLLAPWTTYAINAVLYPGRVGYALDKDFAAITVVGYLPLVLVVNPQVPARTVQELIAYAKAKPDAISFGSTGPGSLEQVAAEMLKIQTGVQMVHVPYKGNAPAVTDLIGGQIQMLFTTAPTWAAHANSGRLRALMVTSPQRSGAFPELPTPKEAGLPAFDVYSTYGLLAPAGTPPSIIKRLNEAMLKVLEDPDTRTRFGMLGIEAAPSTPEAATRRIAGDMTKWESIIKAANIKAE